MCSATRGESEARARKAAIPARTRTALGVGGSAVNWRGATIGREVTNEQRASTDLSAPITERILPSPIPVATTLSGRPAPSMISRSPSNSGRKSDHCFVRLKSRAIQPTDSCALSHADHSRRSARVPPVKVGYYRQARPVGLRAVPMMALQHRDVMARGVMWPLTIDGERRPGHDIDA